MLVVKRCLIGLGALVVIAGLIIGYVVLESFKAADEGEMFAERFFTSFSEAWSVAAVEDRMTEDNVTQFNSAEGEKVLAQLASFGQLQRIEGFTLVGHSITPMGSLTACEFMGQFQNGQLAVRMILLGRGNEMKLKDMALMPVGQAPQPAHST